MRTFQIETLIRGVFNKERELLKEFVRQNDIVGFKHVINNNFLLLCPEYDRKQKRIKFGRGIFDTLFDNAKIFVKKDGTRILTTQPSKSWIRRYYGLNYYNLLAAFCKVFGLKYVEKPQQSWLSEITSLFIFEVIDWDKFTINSAKVLKPSKMVGNAFELSLDGIQDEEVGILKKI